MELYWTIVATIFAGIWTIISMLRERKRQDIEDSHAIIARLLELDRIIIDNPDITKYLSFTALENEQFFRDEKRLEDILFFKVKSFVYAQLNMFDEVLSVAVHVRSGAVFFNSSMLIEESDWENYIKHNMTHPLYQSILNNEGIIFGQCLQNFWKKHQQELTSKSADRFSW